MFNKLLQKETKLAVIGLGYVGLPIALAFAKKIKVVGFDINQTRVDMMRNQVDPSGELTKADFEGADIHFSADLEDLKDVTFYIVAVPTPIDSNNLPDLRPLIGASNTVGKTLKKGDIVVYESTVYPGCTEEDCIPILEEQSGLKFLTDFKVGYSPERINPGDKEHTLAKITKVVSGCDEASLDTIAEVYRIVIDAGVHKASSIKVAEASKIIENTQRDLNIALMNELSIICDKLNISTYEVLEAAGTKWNFLKFSPGLVGGHCIGVDPYYLTYKANKLGHKAKVILSGREINDNMGAYVANKTVHLMVNARKEISKTRVLVMGATFKENVEDIRNSKVVDVIRELESFHVSVDTIDPHASGVEFEHEYKLKLQASATGKYDAIIVAVNHHEYKNLSESYFETIAAENAVFIDLKGIYSNKINNLTYWSL
jgi:UDP-N-acetyl-D-galactosamine dehydrogenase